MSDRNGSFLVEEFLEAITSQLDRTQDALRVKALNRPLTYALKDFSLELKAFVEMDSQGSVRFRSSGPNEPGASTVRIGFTTITKPMIEENTISLSETKSPSLEELGLNPVERKQLERRFGVRNAAQLKRLHSSTGTSGVSRLSGIPVNRLRRALLLGRPRLKQIKPVSSRKDRPKPERSKRKPDFLRRQSKAKLPPGFDPKRRVRRTPPPSDPEGSEHPTPVVRLAPDTRRLLLTGRNLIGEHGPPAVRLNDRVLGISQADENQIIVDVPEDTESGSLEIELPDGEILTYALSVEPDQESVMKDDYIDRNHYESADPWAPNGGGL